MSDMEILESLFKAEVRIPTREEHYKTVAELHEPQAADSVVKILGLPSDAFIIKADCFSSSNKVFTGSKGECKRADFIVISELKKSILYIELKKTTKDLTHITQQLAGAKCFIEYCRAVVKWFWEDHSFLEKYKERYVCFGHTGTSSKKRPTRAKNQQVCHETPNKAQRIDWPSERGIYFSKLMGVYN